MMIPTDEELVIARDTYELVTHPVHVVDKGP